MNLARFHLHTKYPRPVPVMNALKKVALAILLFSLLVFIALFGSLPALRYETLHIQYDRPLMLLQEDPNWPAQPLLVDSFTCLSTLGRPTVDWWTIYILFLAPV